MKISTKLQADNAPLGIHRVTGAVGLYLKVGESGSASWFYRYRLGDKRREMGVGSRDVIGLAEARDAAKDAAGLVRKGIDPIDERRRVKAENLARSRTKPAATFEQMAADYLKTHGADWKHKYARSMWWNSLVRYVMPVIGDLGLDQIELSHITTIMQRAKDAGAPEQARRVRASVELVLNRAIRAGGKAVGNPADAKLHPSKRKGERPHYRAVDLEAAPSIFQELKARSDTSTAFAAWPYMILTASRPSESLNAKWSEIDRDKKLWTIPASRMKSGREHKVPLSQAALEILDRQEAVKTGDAIFPGRGGSPLSYDTFASAPARAKPHIDAATPHGWRSVFRDWCGDIGDVERDLAEAALAHSLASVELASVEASYRRRTAVERRRKVMENYSQWLHGDGVAKVLRFPSRKKA
jgi:integrase